MREHRDTEQRGEVTQAEELADDGGGRRHRGEPGEAQPGRKDVVGPLGLGQHHVRRYEQCATTVHGKEDVLAAITRDALAGIEAAEDIAEPDDGERPASHAGW